MTFFNSRINREKVPDKTLREKIGCCKKMPLFRTDDTTSMNESAPLLTPREDADAPSRRVRIMRVVGASLLAAGAVVAVDGAFPGMDAVALLRSGQMPSVSPAPRELQQAQELMMAQEQQQIQADAQVAAVDQAPFEDREPAFLGRRGRGMLTGHHHLCLHKHLCKNKGVARTYLKYESHNSWRPPREPGYEGEVEGG